MLNLHTYSELVFALVENLDATLRRRPNTDLRKLARSLHVQTFAFRPGDRGRKFISGRPADIVTANEFFDDLIVTLNVA